jgi:cation transport ATPase
MVILSLSADVRLVVVATGIFFFTGLLTGAWKYRHMLHRSDHQAPVYVSIAHSAALQYSFACLVLLVFVALSAFPVVVNALAAAVVLLFFASAVGTYIVLGLRDRTDNQFERRTMLTTWGMWALMAGEIGGFSVLALGVLLRFLP